MSVVNNTLEKEQEIIENDIEDTVIEAEQKMAALREKLASKKKGEVMPPKIVEKKKRRTFEFGVIGTGHCGSRVASELYKLGYNAVALNTATQDLEQIELPETNKLLLQYGIGGAAKDTTIGHEAADLHREEIMNLLDEKLNDSHVYLLCLSLGGGSGAGSHDVLIDILSSTGKPVVVIAVLPMSVDDVQSKQNALNTLASLAKYTQNKTIHNLIVVDNAKLEAIYSNVSHVNFFSVANKAIVKTIDVFNRFSSESSFEKPLDSMEWAKLFSDGDGLCVYGELEVENYADDITAIAEAVVENHENGLLASGFDLTQAKYAGAIIVANAKAWEQIPRASVDHAVSLIKESCPGVEDVFRGVYIDESVDNVVVYSMFSGLGLPGNRVSQLRKDVESDRVKTEARAKARNVNLTLDTGTEETVSQAQKIREQISKKKSAFSKNFGTGQPLDFRKK